MNIYLKQITDMDIAITVEDTGNEMAVTNSYPTKSLTFTSR